MEIKEDRGHSENGKEKIVVNKQALKKINKGHTKHSQHRKEEETEVNKQETKENRGHSENGKRDDSDK